MPEAPIHGHVGNDRVTSLRVAQFIPSPMWPETMKVRIFPEVRADLTLNLFVPQFDSQPSLLSRLMVIAMNRLQASGATLLCAYRRCGLRLLRNVQELADKEKIPEAIALTKINASHFPDSYYTFFVLAELYKTSSQSELAIESYARAIELNPRAERFLGAKIAELRADAE